MAEPAGDAYGISRAFGLPAVTVLAAVLPAGPLPRLRLGAVA
jgi:hypothetical protein